jgi:hypothetical protein
LGLGEEGRVEKGREGREGRGEYTSRTTFTMDHSCLELALLVGGLQLQNLCTHANSGHVPQCPVVGGATDVKVKCFF